MKKLIITAALFLFGVAANGQSVTTAHSVDSIVWEHHDLNLKMYMYIKDGVMYDRAGDVPLGVIDMGIEGLEAYCWFHPYYDEDRKTTYPTYRIRIELEVYPAWLGLHIVE